MKSTQKKHVGRPLIPRTDTERLDLLVKLIGFGRGRADVSFGWGRGLELSAGPAGHGQKIVAADDHGDLRQLLDRALSRNAAPRQRRKP